MIQKAGKLFPHDQKYIYILLVFFISLTLPKFVQAEVEVIEIDINNFNSFIEDKVSESFSYSGLASFYNGITAYIINEDLIKKLDENNFSILTPNMSLVIVGHYKILVISNVNATISTVNQKFNLGIDFQNEHTLKNQSIQAQFLLKSDLTQMPKPFEKLKYVHLWEPFRLLCIYVEAFLLWLYSLHNFGWGVSIILLSLFFKIFTLPVNIFLIRSQRKVSHLQARLESKLEKIKANFSGEDAHKKLMDAHKELGVTPFYSLKPLLLILLPVPFLIAIFNVLGEFDLIAGASFMWISDLAYPDAIYGISRQIPFLGNTINLLPILMTMITIFAALLHHNKIVSVKKLRNQKLNLYFMALGFLFLFYPFPSVMVLYWTFANIWQLIQQRFISI